MTNIMKNSDGSTNKHYWGQLVLPINATIKDAIQILNVYAKKIALITDANGILVGTIVDGDIRRGLLKGLTISSPIIEIINREPLTVTLELSRAAVGQIMTNRRIMQIPIVDSRLKLIGLYLWDEIFKPHEYSNTVVIMAGGKGLRLLPHTENRPKGMLLIAGKPILEHILNRFKAEGFSQFVIAIQHLGYQIENYFGDGKQLGVNIEYLKESSPLGTAGALSLLNPAPTDSFLVTNCDVMTGAQITELLEFHKQNGATATMAVKNHEWVNPFGVVEIEGIEIIGYREKPIIRSTINAGLYVLEPKVLDYFNANNAIDMSTLFEKFLLNKERVVSYPIFESWLDIGTPFNLAEAYKMNYIEDLVKKE